MRYSKSGILKPEVAAYCTIACMHTERHDDQSRRHALTRTPQGRTTRIGNRTTEVRNAKPHANAELQFRTHTHSHERKGTNFWRTQRGAECGPKTPPLGQTGATTRSRHPSRGNDLNLSVACARQGPRSAAELKRSTKMTIFHPKCEETQTSAHRRHYRIRKSPIHAMQRTPAAKDLKLLLYWWISQSLGKTYPRATAGFLPHAAQCGAIASLFARGTPTRPIRRVCTERGSIETFCAKKGYPPPSGTTSKKPKTAPAGLALSCSCLPDLEYRIPDFA